MEVKVYSRDGNIVGKEELPPSLFGQRVNDILISEVIRAYRANARQGTVSTKKRGEVSGGGRKPWRQKHTGRARAGSIRSPIWRGGGVVFGPKPRDYTINILKKKRRLALLSSLSLMAEKGKVLVVDEIVMDSPNTKRFYSILTNLGIKDGTKVLFTLDTTDENLYKSGRNIPGVSFTTSYNLNGLMVLSTDVVIFSLKGLGALKERFG